MCQVNVFQAKSELSKLLAMLENRDETEIIIARNGKPVAKMTRWEESSASRRIGVAKGLFTVPDDFDTSNAEINALFSGTQK